MKISIVIPARDERDTLGRLVAGILDSAATQLAGQSIEIVLVDDGSTDGSWKKMQELAATHREVQALRLRRNFGKAIALGAGFKVATGDIIVTMDADLQDDPKEIPRFVTALESGSDLVSGWKYPRLDPLSKTLPSLMFNRVTAWITGVQLHDFNCGYKAYRREVVERLKLYGELHRYIPVLAHDAGFRIGEIKVEHHPRRHGRSKYGIERFARGFLDLITVLATTRYLRKPGHLFGGAGLLSGALGALILVYLTLLWGFGYGPIGNRPLFFFGIMLVILSVQMLSLGVLAELLIRLSNEDRFVDVVVEDSRPPVGGCR